MNSKYIVSHLGEEVGPFSSEELRGKWTSGELLPIDYVYDENLQDWIMLEEFFKKAPTPVAAQPALPPLPPPPPPPKPQARRTFAPKVSANTTVKIVDGIGEIELSPKAPGHMEIIFQESTSTRVQLPSSTRFEVHSAEPVCFEWTCKETSSAGEKVDLVIEAKDESGHVCQNHSDEVRVVVFKEGSELADPSRILPISIVAGQAKITLENTLAESWRLRLEHDDSGEGKRLRLPEERSLLWEPGPAVKLIIENPNPLIAGHQAKVKLQAVDSYGNLAKTFQGTVVLEIKAS